MIQTTAGGRGGNPDPGPQILENHRVETLDLPKFQNMFPKSMIQITAGVNPDPGPQILENPRAESLDLRGGSYRPKSTNLGAWTPSGRALDPRGGEPCKPKSIDFGAWTPSGRALDLQKHQFSDLGPPLGGAPDPEKQEKGALASKTMEIMKNLGNPQVLRAPSPRTPTGS